MPAPNLPAAAKPSSSWRGWRHECPSLLRSGPRSDAWADSSAISHPLYSPDYNDALVMTWSPRVQWTQEWYIFPETGERSEKSRKSSTVARNFARYQTSLSWKRANKLCDRKQITSSINLQYKVFTQASSAKESILSIPKSARSLALHQKLASQR